ncbi:MAG: SDR family oxidoreductase [Acidobacteriota bacterium]|nr:SDR family oxidoreductase [Acidobacteriota bacterium]
MRSPQNASVLITGAGRGIGKRLAIGFAHSGARVGLLGRNQAELDVTKLEIEHAKGAALRLRADVRNYEQVSAAVERMTAAWGGVHTLVANAGTQGPIGPFAEQKPRDWTEVFDVNVMGVLNCCRAVLPQMIHRRSGKIIVIAGMGAANPRPNFAPYAASKAAIVRFVETLADEVRDHNVQVNSVFPGEAYTNMTDEVLEAGASAGAAEIELAERVRITGGTPPDKQIQLALFLASERSNHVTGKLIYVQDDWKRLEDENGRPDVFTLRRHSNKARIA